MVEDESDKPKIRSARDVAFDQCGSSRVIWTGREPSCPTEMK